MLENKSFSSKPPSGIEPETAGLQNRVAKTAQPPAGTHLTLFNGEDSYIEVLHTAKLEVYLDLIDAPLFAAHSWRLVNGYIARRVGDKLIYLHREIMQPTVGQQVDHINRNRLDCQRANLRVVTPGVNQHNRRAWGRSKYRGVGLHKTSGRWRARIKVDGKSIEIGRFKTEEEAAAAYDRKAVEVYGDDAACNLPDSLGMEAGSK